MPKFEVEVPHTLGQEAAVKRLQGFSEKIQQQHADKIKDFEQQWDGERLSFAFKTLGLRIEGRMTVEPDKVRVEGDLPFAAAMFKGQLTGAIQSQLERLVQ